MVDYAGWDMPVSYAGTVAEVDAVRSAVGLFDVSHMGEFHVTGPGALDFLQYLTSNDVTRIGPLQAQYSLMLNPDGGVVDDIIVYQLAAGDYLVVVNAGCKDKDLAWVAAQARRFNVRMSDESDHTALLALQGPAAVAMVDKLCASGTVGGLARFGLREESLDGIRCIVSRTGYTGEDGVEIFCEWAEAPVVWNRLVTAGAARAGLAARDVLRLEAAYPLYGHELLENVSPLESGAAWAVKTKKGNFVGRDAVLAARSRGPESSLVGLRMVDRAIPREHYPVLSTDGDAIGVVTSGTFSPTIKAGIAMARISKEFGKPDTEVVVDIRGRRQLAVVVNLPFYRNGV